MHWLIEILIDVVTWLLPGRGSHDDRSIVGTSPLDRRARLIAWAVVVVIAIGVAGYFLTRS